MDAGDDGRRQEASPVVEAGAGGRLRTTEKAWTRGLLLQLPVGMVIVMALVEENWCSLREKMICMLVLMVLLDDREVNVETVFDLEFLFRSSVGTLARRAGLRPEFFELSGQALPRIVS
ncbi:hypothetical protein L484_024945 [Morus notabilis]|uniref:Uncharacterized protein n=1 Tax=Morus notabilis TaxID=981085 RepID=W9R3J8_9ROSA|nr:hypothetical protein L484_024945 [Morus notabilis]